LRSHLYLFFDVVSDGPAHVVDRVDHRDAHDVLEDNHRPLTLGVELGDRSFLGYLDFPSLDVHCRAPNRVVAGVRRGEDLRETLPEDRHDRHPERCDRLGGIGTREVGHRDREQCLHDGVVLVEPLEVPSDLRCRFHRGLSHSVDAGASWNSPLLFSLLHGPQIGARFSAASTSKAGSKSPRGLRGAM
jgi:hypothetical protein